MSDPFRPATLDEFVGQARLVARLRAYLDAALLSVSPLPHLLLCAPGGMGKSTLAHVLAGSLGDPVHTLTMPADGRELERLVAREHGVLVLAQLDAAPKAMAARLASLIDTGQLPSARGALPNDRLTIVGTTAEAVPALLYERLLVAPFNPYSPDDLVAIVAGMAQRAHLQLADDVVAGLGRAATGLPGHARRLVEAAVALTMGGNEPSLPAVLALAGYSADGLTDAHFGYLEALDLLGGSASLPVLSVTTRLHPSVCQDVERGLFADDLVVLGPRGTRDITKRAMARLRARREEAA